MRPAKSFKRSKTTKTNAFFPNSRSAVLRHWQLNNIALNQEEFVESFLCMKWIGSFQVTQPVMSTDRSKFHFQQQHIFCVVGSQQNTIENHINSSLHKSCRSVSYSEKAWLPEKKRKEWLKLERTELVSMLRAKLSKHHQHSKNKTGLFKVETERRFFRKNLELFHQP